MTRHAPQPALGIPPTHDPVTRLLELWKQGEKNTADELVTLLYSQLKRIASSQLGREREALTLQATAVVHEAYLRLREVRGIDWENRSHFVAFSAHLIRRVLVDHARARQRLKAGEGWRRVELEPSPELGYSTPPSLLVVHEALEALGRLDRRKAQVVELRFFGGFSVEETAQLLELSVETVGRDWRRAKAWLHEFLTPGGTVPHEA